MAGDDDHCGTGVSTTNVLVLETTEAFFCSSCYVMFSLVCIAVIFFVSLHK